MKIIDSVSYNPKVSKMDIFFGNDLHKWIGR